MASFNSGFDISSTKGGVVDIEFDCKPFKYDIMGEETITLTGDTTHYLENPYFEEARPIVTVYGRNNGTLNVYINEKTIAINSIAGYVTIDTELQDAYKGNSESGFVNKNHTVNTADFSLKSGTNAISYSADVIKVEITPRWVTI
jgi:phage-related protein